MSAHANRVTIWEHADAPTHDLATYDNAKLSEHTRSGIDVVKIRTKARNVPDELLENDLDGWPIHCSFQDETIYQGEVRGYETQTDYSGRYIVLACIPGRLQ